MSGDHNKYCSINNPKDEWKEITDPEELFKLKREGWEIEFANSGSQLFAKWSGLVWHADRQFRARPHQPKMKKVTLLAFIGPLNLSFVRSDKPEDIAFYEQHTDWFRQPKLDLEAEIPDEQ